MENHSPPATPSEQFAGITRMKTALILILGLLSQNGIANAATGPQIATLLMSPSVQACLRPLAKIVRDLETKNGSRIEPVVTDNAIAVQTADNKTATEIEILMVRSNTAFATYSLTVVQTEEPSSLTLKKIVSCNLKETLVSAP